MPGIALNLLYTSHSASHDKELGMSWPKKHWWYGLSIKFRTKTQRHLMPKSKFLHRKWYCSWAARRKPCHTGQTIQTYKWKGMCVWVKWEKKTCVQSTNVVCTSLEEFGWMFVGSWISHTEEHVNTSQWRKQAPIHWLWKTLLLLWMWSEVTERNVCVHVRACICVWIRIVQMTENCAYKGQTMW